MTNNDHADPAPLEDRQHSFEAFLGWLRQLESENETGVRSKQFWGDWMNCYTRSSRFCSGALGTQVIDFANIEVKAGRRGERYLSELLAFLEVNLAQLKATHFYFENVANARLGAWLLRQGFDCVNGMHGEVASYCRLIQPSKT